MLSVRALRAVSTLRPGSHWLKQEVDLFVQVKGWSLGRSGASGTDWLRDLSQVPRARLLLSARFPAVFPCAPKLLHGGRTDGPVPTWPYALHTQEMEFLWSFSAPLLQAGILDSLWSDRQGPSDPWMAFAGWPGTGQNWSGAPPGHKRGEWKRVGWLWMGTAVSD